MIPWLLLHQSFAVGVLGGLFALALLVVVMASDWELTPRARQMLADIEQALRRTRGQLKVATAEMQTTPPLLSRVLRPQQANWITRFADLGDDFEREVIATRASRVGLIVIDQKLALALAKLERAEARLARKAALKMAAFIEDEEQSA